MIVQAVTIFRGAVSVAWLMKGTCGPKGDERGTRETEAVDDGVVAGRVVEQGAGGRKRKRG